MPPDTDTAGIAPATPAPPRADALPAHRRAWRTFRKTLFWLHLTAGCVAGLIIFSLCVTGVLLTYERQMLAAFETHADPGPDATRLPVTSLIEAARERGVEPREIRIGADEGAPVALSAGRRERVILDAYTGEVVEPGAPALEAMFGWITRFHRWFALEGDARGTARAVTGAANLTFLFIMVSGLVLWLPPVMHRQLLGLRLWFRSRYATAKARDFAWHHVIGIWCLVPLMVLAATGTVFYYEFAGKTLRWMVGAQPETAASGQQGPGNARGGAGPQAPGEGAARQGENAVGALAGSTAALPVPAESAGFWLESAAAAAPGWKSLTLTLPEPDATTVEVVVDRGNGVQVQHQRVLTLDAATGQPVSEHPNLQDDPYRYARSYVRFLHTGEIYGFAGQTVAGIASLGGALLAWTGIALAWRRLVLMPLRKRRARAARA